MDVLWLKIVGYLACQLSCPLLRSTPTSRHSNYFPSLDALPSFVFHSFTAAHFFILDVLLTIFVSCYSAAFLLCISLLSYHSTLKSYVPVPHGSMTL